MAVQYLCRRSVHLTLTGLLLGGLAYAEEPPLRPNPRAESPDVVRRPAHPREPWKWTLEERLAVRFDPVDMQRRADANAKDNEAPSYSKGQCIVEGARSPELLLPSEVFSALLRRAFNPVNEMRETYRKDILEQGRALGFDESLWPVLEKLAHDEILSMKKARDAAKLYREKGIRPPDSSTADQKIQCTKRAQGREAVRAYFGAERFDRFLYEVIARHVAVFMEYHPERPQQLLLLEKGCTKG